MRPANFAALPPKEPKVFKTPLPTLLNAGTTFETPSLALAVALLAASVALDAVELYLSADRRDSWKVWRSMRVLAAIL